MGESDREELQLVSHISFCLVIRKCSVKANPDWNKIQLILIDTVNNAIIIVIQFYSKWNKKKVK